MSEDYSDTGRIIGAIETLGEGLQSFELTSGINPEFATVRDKFAMAALSGILAHSCSNDLRQVSNEEIAQKAFRLADVMLEARKQEK